MPWFVEWFFPKSKLVMHEETFNSHPFFLATLTLPEFLGDKFCMTVKSKVVATRELAENTFRLSPEDLDKRKTTTLDIAGSEFESKKYEGERPDNFQSKRRTRGPLGENWRDSDAVLSVTLLTSYSEVEFVHPVSPGGSVKFVASGINFSIFTHFLCFFLLKLLKLGEIDGVKFLT